MSSRQAHIETITKGPTQRVRRTVGYRVIGDGKEIARFDIDQSDVNAALIAARKTMEAYKAGETP